MSRSSTQYHELPDYGALVDRLYEVRSAIDAEYTSFIKATPKRHRDDARITAIAHLGQLTDSTILLLTFIKNHLLPLDNSWWEEVYRLPFKNFSERHKSILINNLTVGFGKLGFLQNLFGIIDSSFRLFLRALEPALEPPIRFVEVHKRLERYLTSWPQGSNNLLQLLARTRNTVHNNGVYFFSGRDFSVTYKGKAYKFNHGQTIRFVTWEWLVEIIPEVLALLTYIIRDSRISSLDYVRDPFSAGSGE